MRILSETRHKKVFLIAVSFISLAGLALHLGCPGPAPEQQAGLIDVLIRNFGFEPDSLTITQGDTVRWINLDIVPHTATSGNPDNPGNIGNVFQSVWLAQNESFTHQFNDTGTFIYFCEVHPVMMRDARVIVEEAPAEGEGDGEAGEGGG